MLKLISGILQNFFICLHYFFYPLLGLGFLDLEIIFAGFLTLFKKTFNSLLKSVWFSFNITFALKNLLQFY